MATVRSSNVAWDDLSAVGDYIARDSVRHAQLTMDRIYAVDGRLERFPRSGRIVPEFGRDDVREVIVGNYRVVYRLVDDAVEIMTIVHAARRFPTDGITERLG